MSYLSESDYTNINRTKCYHLLQLSSEGIGLQQASPATGIWAAAKTVNNSSRKWRRTTTLHELVVATHYMSF